MGKLYPEDRSVEGFQQEVQMESDVFRCVCWMVNWKRPGWDLS